MKMSSEHCVCGILFKRGVFYIQMQEHLNLAYNDTPRVKNLILEAKEDQSFNTTTTQFWGKMGGGQFGSISQ